MPSRKKKQAAKDAAVVSQPRTSPVFVTPMAAHAVEKLPEGPEWLYELKFEGSPYAGAVITHRRLLGTLVVRKKVNPQRRAGWQRRASFKVVRHMREQHSCVKCSMIVQTPAPSRRSSVGWRAPRCWRTY